MRLPPSVYPLRNSLAAKELESEPDARLAVARTELETTNPKRAQRELKDLEPRLSFSPKRPDGPRKLHA